MNFVCFVVIPAIHLGELPKQQHKYQTEGRTTSNDIDFFTHILRTPCK